MEVTINIEDLSNLTVLSSNRSEYRLVKESVFEDVETKLEELVRKSKATIVS